MYLGDRKIKDIVRYPYIENDVNKALFCEKEAIYRYLSLLLNY